MNNVENLKFLQPHEVLRIAEQYGTPVFVYDFDSIKRHYEYFASIPNAYGLKIRYSVKANPNRNILRIFDKLGARFDVSSTWEAKRVIDAGVKPTKILLTGQEMTAGWQYLCDAGIEFDAGSLNQLDQYGRVFRGKDASIRVNPGFGSGLVKKLTSGGNHSSFGIWHEQLGEALAIAEQHHLNITRLHFHIGSGHETTVLEETVSKALGICEHIPSVSILNLGGGYRIAALAKDPKYDHHAMGTRIAEQLEIFAKRTGRRIKLELEPGTYLMALAGSIITRIIDVVSTGDNGYRFVKIDGGLTEIIRPSYYGALHPMVSVAANGVLRVETESYMVCGHCCIAGDNLTPVPSKSEDFAPQQLSRTEVGDFLVIERTGGYAASMCLKNFNSYPEAAEILRLGDGQYTMIRKRQTLEQIVQNEIDIPIEPEANFLSGNRASNSDGAIASTTPTFSEALR
jgi:diaminopimelate decarboxylase